MERLVATVLVACGGDSQERVPRGAQEAPVGAQTGSSMSNRGEECAERCPWRPASFMD